MAVISTSGQRGASPLLDQGALPTPHVVPVMIALMIAMMMQILDTTIANVALPHMQASLGASQETISWVLTSYIVALAIATPVTGWLADRLGARRLMMIAVTTFVLASMLCGIAANLGQMVLFRLLQGVAGAFIGPLCQTLMLDVNKPSDHPRAMSLFSTGMMIGPVFGPVLGGVLTEHFNWRWVFYINLPIGIVCLLLLAVFLPAKGQVRRPFDGFGFAMLAIAIGAFQLALDRGEHLEWLQSPEILLEFALALSFLWMFAVHLMTTRKLPLFNPALLGDRNLISGSLFMGMVGIVTMSSLALLPGLLQSLYGYDVIDTGLMLMSRTVGALITMSLAGRLVAHVNLRLLVLSGLLITAFSLWQMTHWALDIDATSILVSGFIQGFGMGMILTPLNIMSFATLSPQLRTDGAALFNLTRSLGSSIGIAVTMSQLARNMQVSHADLSQQITGASTGIDPLTILAMGDTGATIAAMLNGEVTRQAAMIAYIDDFHLMLIACLVTLPLVLLLRQPREAHAMEPVHIGE